MSTSTLPWLDDLERRLGACVRTLADQPAVSVVIGEPPDDLEEVVSLPPPGSDDRAQSQELLRGISDSHALLRRYHDGALHAALAPIDETAQRLFSLLERERFEALGARRLVGVMHNLDALWLHNHSDERVERYNGAEQLEFMLSCLCREQLRAVKLPPTLHRRVQQEREPIEVLIREPLQALAGSLHDQVRFAGHVCRLIEGLGFDPRTTGQVAALAPDADTESQEDDRAENTSDADDAARQADEAEGSEPVLAEPLEPLSDKVRELEASSLVRNSDSRDLEPEAFEVESLNERIRDAAGGGLAARKSHQSYPVFDASHDEVRRASDLLDRNSLAVRRRELDAYTASHRPLMLALSARLNRVLLASSTHHWEPDQEEGALDNRRLTRIIVDPLLPLAFRAPLKVELRDTVVSMLIDNSRSMFGQPIATAAACADLITRTLERCGVASEVLGFTTVSMYGGTSTEQWKARGSKPGPGRLNSTRHIIYKPASASWRSSRANFGLMLDKDILKQNIDGEALQWAHRRLLMRPESRKILLVLSDGAPSDSSTLVANSKDFLIGHLRSVVRAIESQSAVELSAIGIGHDVGAFYSRSIVVESIEQLSEVLLSELASLLRGG